MTPVSRADIVVASDLPLVADVVAAALDAQGFRCWPALWPARDTGDDAPRGPVPGPVVGPVLGAVLGAPPQVRVGLMISDFERVALIRGALDLLLGAPVPWLVLTGVPRGPLWGALLEIGAFHVAPATLGLDEVAQLVDAAADRRSPTSLRERRSLVSTWYAVRDEHDRMVSRLATMTPRETEVLQLLYAGSPVRAIAEQLDVAEATVRTQVKRVLRKLDVRSQLAAVAALEHVRWAEQTAATTDGVAASMWLGRQMAVAPRA